MTVFIGGVGELLQGDLDFGRVAVESMVADMVGGVYAHPHVVIEELHYGAVAVTQRIAELQPSVMILIGANKRGRPIGPVYRTRVRAPELTPAELQTAVGDAVVGYVALDLVIEVSAGLGVLPARTVTFEIEPEPAEPGDGLSEVATTALEHVRSMVRREIDMLALFELSDTLRMRHYETGFEPSASTRAMVNLLDELELLESEGRWARVFAFRDALRIAVAEHQSSKEMDHQDWALWWAMVEELDRLQSLEVAATGLSG